MHYILKQAEEGQGAWSKDPLSIFLRDVRRYEGFVKDDALKHMRQLRAATDPKTKRKLYEEAVAGNAKLVVSIAFRYRERGKRHGFELLDLIQEGMCGLMKAVEMYDPSLGYQFSTYATHWIHQSIRRALMNNFDHRPMRIPVHYGDFMRNLQGIMQDFLREHGREAEPYEIYALAKSKLRVGKAAPSMKQVASALRYLAMSSTSIDQPFGTDKPKTMGDEGVTLHSVLPSRIPLPDNVIEAKEQLAAFHAVIKHAEEWVERQPLRTQEIVSLRLGLFDKHVLVLDEIGHKFGISRERVRQIEAKAMPELEAATGFSRDEIRHVIRSAERLEVYILSAM